jgi:hypothetical protein
MSSRPQLSPAIGYDHRMFEKTSSLTLRAQGGTIVSCPSVMLVGRSGSWSKSVLKSLEKFGTELLFVEPQLVTPEYIQASTYKLVLLDSTVPVEQRRQLASELVGSNVSMFYTFPVENDCWWLPTLRHGQGCHGAPAFRRNEFPYELERILRAQTES